ncbi:hypothetical protein AYO20_08412 [Fonsecaea nubica]|uniref:Uncharacterized protein n=1 Tax=Fonsecaea nubica TaxID=856822 RepID=A0A178CQA6_9EURO|nr:hypothetical protein AYO20_08412 [Fonsecaea nubica]OAL31081.1 hypothetical protein AYO20_08412 [Fonsecaea nubica]
MAHGQQELLNRHELLRVDGGESHIRTPRKSQEPSPHTNEIVKEPRVDPALVLVTKTKVRGLGTACPKKSRVTSSQHCTTAGAAPSSPLRRFPSSSLSLRTESNILALTPRLEKQGKPVWAALIMTTIQLLEAGMPRRATQERTRNRGAFDILAALDPEPDSSNWLGYPYRPRRFIACRRVEGSARDEVPDPGAWQVSATGTWVPFLELLFCRLALEELTIFKR